jgi:orotidine-5'-phosphate decarboxylase
MSEQNPIIIALDYPNAKQARNFLQSIKGCSCNLKVGLELFIAEGPKFVEQLIAEGHQVFLDLKLHDIPNTVASACKSASSLGVWMMTLHALGGADMLIAARETMPKEEQSIKLIAVTVLTSMDQQQLQTIGLQQSPADVVMTLAKTAMDANMDGLVCSVHELSNIRNTWGKQPLVVTPGIRLQNDQTNDQSRVASPSEAKSLGSDYIVVGRPITRAKDPIDALNQYLGGWNSSNA